jgi:hypothetical protein
MRGVSGHWMTQQEGGVDDARQAGGRQRDKREGGECETMQGRLGGKQHDKRRGAEDTLLGDGAVDNTLRGKSRQLRAIG